MAFWSRVTRGHAASSMRKAPNRSGLLDNSELWHAHSRQQLYTREYLALGGELVPGIPKLIKELAECELADLIRGCSEHETAGFLSDEELGRRYFRRFPGVPIAAEHLQMLIDALHSIALSSLRTNQKMRDVDARAVSSDQIEAAMVRLPIIFESLTVRRSIQNETRVERQRRNASAAAVRRAKAEAEAAKQESEQKHLVEERESRKMARIQREMMDLPGLIQGQIDLELDRLDAELSQFDKTLLKATQSFDLREFTPFWEQIERAITGLQSAQHRAVKVEELSERHLAAVKALADELPLGQWHPLPLKMADRSIALTDRIDRAGELVRRAQRDFQFAQIWELRRNTAAITSGFLGLGAAVDQLRASIGTSKAAGITRSRTTSASPECRNDR